MDVKNLFTKKTDEEKFKLSEESASKEVQKILDYYDIDIDKDFDAEYKKIFEQSIAKAIKAVRLGRLSVKVDDNGISITQSLKNGKTSLTYREIDGRAKLATATVGKDDSFGKIYEIMGSLSGLGSSAIAEMKGVDLSLCECLGTIFLSV